MLAAAAAGSAPMPQTTEGYDGRLDIWLETWLREAMLDVLKLLAQARGQEAERHVRGRCAVRLKAQRLSLPACAPYECPASREPRTD